MIGQFVAHYKILEKLGEGGMGVVYKAEDTKLKRTVALKFLPPELTRDLQAKKRFLQEAQAAAALDHPNICAVFEIGEAEGTTYIAMPYVRGQSLKEKIAAGPLAVEEALDIAGRVGEGLKEAHEKGIIHRDIKPANIMLTEKGQAKIMDFGLAKLAWAVDLTKTAGTMGTLAYMSPEQARGDIVDHRTDIWSLGVVLYEMLAGQLPFTGESTQGVVYSILNKDPEPLSVLRPDIPRPVVQVVTKALEKDSSRRYQNIQELIQDLKTPSPLSFPKAEKSIVVLPFEDLSPGKDNDYFSDGLTEEIITDLSQVHDLLVISRSSAMTFKGTKKTIPEIARAVSVRYVLEGSVRKAGNNLRITAQLIDATNDAHLWAEKYSGTLDDVFDIQEKASRSIVDALRLKLTPEERHRVSVRPIDNFAVYECYLRAYQEMYKFTEEGRTRALNYLNSGLAISGDNALLYSAMAFTYWQYWLFGMKTDEIKAKAEECIKKALALDPRSPKAYAIRGWMVYDIYLKPQESLHHFKQALAISPDEFEALHGLARAYIYAGKIQEAVPLSERMMLIDPLNPICWMFQGAMHFWDGRFDLALERLQKAYQMSPENPSIMLYYVNTLARLNLVQEAFSIISQSEAASPKNLFTKWVLLLKYGLLNDREKLFQEMTADFLESIRKNSASYYIAVPLALVGAKTEAIEWLENDVGWFFNYPFFAEKDPFLANLRGGERFQKLMERVKYEWEHFEV
jgi:serine/threonine protein kinase/thioredoxin-like negative regulator of GroEL